MKEIFIKVCDYYIEHVKVVEGMNSYSDMLDYLRSKELHLGVCWLTTYKFGKHAFYSTMDLIKKYYLPGDKVWCTLPYQTSNTNDLLLSLTKRVDILNDIIAGLD